MHLEQLQDLKSFDIAIRNKYQYLLVGEDKLVLFLTLKQRRKPFGIAIFTFMRTESKWNFNLWVNGHELYMEFMDFRLQYTQQCDLNKHRNTEKACIGDLLVTILPLDELRRTKFISALDRAGRILRHSVPWHGEKNRWAQNCDTK